MTHHEHRDSSALISKVILTVLILVALGLGVSIYQKNNQSPKQLADVTNAASSNTTSSNNVTNQIAVSDQNLTADQKALFYTPGKDATPDQLTAFSTLVASNAKVGDTIVVKDCTASPTVLKLKYGSTFSVKNTGTTDIHFGFGTERTLVKSGTTSNIVANFKNGPGIYGYGCDSPTVSRSIGLLLITQ